VNESEMKQHQRAANSQYKDRLNNISRLFGGTSNTKRERLYQEFGYPVELSFEDFYRAYKRNAIGGAAVKRMLDCWEDYPEVFEGDKSKDSTQLTPWDKKINKLLKRCWKQIRGADRRNLVGRYSALLIQLKDGGKWSEEVNAAAVRLLKERALVRLIPVWEAQIEPVSWESDEDSQDFGMPTMYSFMELPVEGQKDSKPGRIIDVHPSRVIILAEGADDDNLSSGTSLLEAGFNNLLDIEKVSGGSSEGFLKNASRQLNYSFSEKTNFPALAKALGVDEGRLSDALDEQVRRMNNNTDAASFMQAGTAEVLSVAAADPEPTWRTALSAFAATVPIPVKVIIGQITGERASGEDMKDWARTRMTRRKGFLTDLIIEIVTRFWTLGVIETPGSDGEITVQWSDLLAPSESDKIENMNKTAEVAEKTTRAFGRSAITENEVRAAGELQTDPSLDGGNEDGKPKNRPDPLADDETKQPGNTPQQS
jgi:hypothetical protein